MSSRKNLLLFSILLFLSAPLFVQNSTAKTLPVKNPFLLTASSFVQEVANDSLKEKLRRSLT
ncbi:MAG: hypothetical protein PWQ38_726, partial [Proteiniphilum sp.]|nr:hypothetical protein [Proteiniphilum sp.]